MLKTKFPSQTPIKNFFRKCFSISKSRQVIPNLDNWKTLTEAEKRVLFLFRQNMIIIRQQIHWFLCRIKNQQQRYQNILRCAKCKRFFKIPADKLKMLRQKYPNFRLIYFWEY